LFIILDATFNETTHKKSAYELCINKKIDLGSFPVTNQVECEQSCVDDIHCANYKADWVAGSGLECTKFKACNGTATTKAQAKKEIKMVAYQLAAYTDQHWRSVLRSLPGVAILAVGWVIVLVWMTSYCFLEIYCTLNDPKMSEGLKSFTIFACGLLAFTGYLAHGGTIPKVSEKYPGPALYVLSFCLFIVAKTLATCSQRTERKPAHVVVELCAAGSTLFAFFLAVGSGTLSGLIIAALCLVIWANLLCTKTVMNFTSWELVPDLGNNCPWPPLWELFTLRGPEANMIGMGGMQNNVFKSSNSPRAVNSGPNAFNSMGSNVQMTTANASNTPGGMRVARYPGPPGAISPAAVRPGAVASPAAGRPPPGAGRPTYSPMR